MEDGVAVRCLVVLWIEMTVDSGGRMRHRCFLSLRLAGLVECEVFSSPQPPPSDRSSTSVHVLVLVLVLVLLLVILLLSPRCPLVSPPHPRPHLLLRNLLVGSALPEKRISRVVELLENDPVVSSVHDVKAIIIGADRGRFKAEINFDAKTLARRSIQRCKRSLQTLQSNLSATEVENVMLTYSTEMLAQIGDEVDRLEVRTGKGIEGW
eukprot:746316-Hanusia_phi.AAC.1